MTTKRRPGGRTARVREAVLGATRELLREEGFAALTVERVARRAGVHRTTLHRRWPSRAALVADALLEVSAVEVPIPDSGDVAIDLRMFAGSVRDVIASAAGRGIISALADPRVLEELATVNRRFWDVRFAATGQIVERAIGREELPAGVDPRYVIEAVGGPIWFRAFVVGEHPDDDFLDFVVDTVVAGLRASARV